MSSVRPFCLSALPFSRSVLHVLALVSESPARSLLPESLPSAEQKEKMRLRKEAALAAAQGARTEAKMSQVLSRG